MLRSCFGKLPVAAIVVHSIEELKSDRVQLSLRADLYLDAMLGTGFKPPVSGLYAEAIAIMNASQVPVIAVDIPSGADADAMGAQSGTIARADADRHVHCAASGARVQLANRRADLCGVASARRERRSFRRCN